ncbi:hypothetical protein V5799_016177, partial [Amblyomma americanum]
MLIDLESLRSSPSPVREYKTSARFWIPCRAPPPPFFCTSVPTTLQQRQRKLPSTGRRTSSEPSKLTIL